MASIGTSAPASPPPVTVTVTKGYDWALSAQKFMHQIVSGAVVAVGTVLALCLQSEEVRAALLASVTAHAGPIVAAAAPILFTAGWKFLDNWQKHRHDKPAEVTVVPLVESPK